MFTVRKIIAGSLFLACCQNVPAPVAAQCHRGSYYWYSYRYSYSFNYRPPVLTVPTPYTPAQEQAMYNQEMYHRAKAQELAVLKENLDALAFAKRPGFPTAERALPQASLARPNSSSPQAAAKYTSHPPSAGGIPHAKVFLITSQQARKIGLTFADECGRFQYLGCLNGIRTFVDIHDQLPTPRPNCPTSRSTYWVVDSATIAAMGGSGASGLIATHPTGGSYYFSRCSGCKTPAPPVQPPSAPYNAAPQPIPTTGRFNSFGNPSRIPVVD